MLTLRLFVVFTTLIVFTCQDHATVLFPELSSPQDQQRIPSEYAKRRPAALRNCFLSPVQCLLPVHNRRFNKFHKRFIFSD
ncbi:unnamed protein product [Heligmosomoides polygyrus]|uniref:Secreted protein n=1 Tax=Heligmosomoides polygyrus TaxID=6339 RepID=A0A183G0S7_HELPZ|nr:unnamed protein product [Heligmosomoides polygyrus]